MLAAQFGDPSRPEIVPAAVVCELTHLATLYHDDVMDEAPVRRGAASANARWDNTVAILTGDFLFSRASNILAGLGPYAVRLQARTFERLVTGQIRETVGARPGVDPIEHYLAVLADKTGSLIATAAEFGAHYAGAGPDVVDSLRTFGEQIGVAFQLSDDILDIASESAESGKTPGTDLREGIATLPALYALRGTGEADRRLRELVGRPLPDDAEHAEALRLLRVSTAMDEARATLRNYADMARATLATLPDVPARAAFATLTQIVIARTG
jgi:heptaprenyl diphosphate synthase